ncbi:MAG: alkaline phosphatase family protein [Chloroflexi bacterium]|nr:alkaline phosphatase family protein [Chloroflexota bacterium]
MTGKTPELASLERKVVLVVIDGLGFSRERSLGVVDAAWDRLNDQDREFLVAAAIGVGRDVRWAKNLLYTVHVESLQQETSTVLAVAWVSDLKTASETLDPELRSRIDTLIEKVANEHRYVPWASGAHDLSKLRNSHLTLPTSAAGIWAGFEDLDPAVQGNSETGHLQIGNTILAPQLPLEITRAIDSGTFFENPALNGIISRASKNGRTINFCVLLSGVGGGDGRVHSAWNHLEAFCELVFVRHKISPEHVQMQAILDGRDSVADSSLVARNGSGDFLGRLQQLLGRYGAEESLAWIIGRSTAMDRDYREASAKQDFDHLMGSVGRPVSGFEEARSVISRYHGEGMTDQDIPPISILRRDQSVPTLSAGDAFVDLNFRSDRQRSKIGSLAGARAFLEKEGLVRGRPWDGSWIDHGLGLDICAIAEYHPIFEVEYGVAVAFPTVPHADNILARWPESNAGDEYTLIAESVKASHMGFFFRGRREGPVSEASEVRLVIPSHGDEDGVRTDTDFYLHPGMRAPEITEQVQVAIESGRSRLICCNIAAPDMVGHLLPARYDEAKAAYRAAANALVRIANSAQSRGYHMVITSDHGNIEDDTSAHSVNDVLTTIIEPGGTVLDVAVPVYQARLFDVAPTILSLLGSYSQTDTSLAAYDDPFTGRPLASSG